MKKLISIILILFPAFFLITCSKTNIVPSLTVTPSTKEIDNGSGNFYLEVTATVLWTAVSDRDWLTLAPASGNRNGTIEVQYQPNSAAESRTAHITLSGKDIENKIVTIIQAGTLPYLTIYPSSQVVTQMAGKADFFVSSNISWTATSSQAWCTIANPSGTLNDTISVNYDANATSGERTAILTITGTGTASKTVKLIQQPVF